jgi:predicted DCC family thiol-disulfide oxidoreductase YuxK
VIAPRRSPLADSTTHAAYSYRSDPAVPNFPDDRPIIIFDGYCALCSGWAQFVLRHDRHGRFESEGSIRMAEGLGWPWSLAAGVRILPRPLRDRLYAFVARNRLRFFGKRATCYVPNAGDEDRFLG